MIIGPLQRTPAAEKGEETGPLNMVLELRTDNLRQDDSGCDGFTR